MRLCLLVDGLGIQAEIQQAALDTWAAKGGDVVASWLIHDSKVGDLANHPGFDVAQGSDLWVHQPGPADPSFFKHLSSVWPPSREIGDRRLATLVWHMQRRWRLITAKAVRDLLFATRRKGNGWCDWVGLFRANSYVNIHALGSMLELEIDKLTKQRGNTVKQDPLVFGRWITAGVQGRAATVIDWGGTDLHALWSSTGLLLNSAAVKLMTEVPGFEGRGTLDYDMTTQITGWMTHVFHIDEAAVMMDEAEEKGEANILEMLFSACLRSQHRDLQVKWWSHQQEHFIIGGFPLERFLFRLGAASFEWSRIDTGNAGLGYHGRARRVSPGDWGLPPQCILAFFPLDTASLQYALHKVVPQVACLPSVDLALKNWPAGIQLQAPRGLGHVHVATAGGFVLVGKPQRYRTSGQQKVRFIRATKSRQWRRALWHNRRIWASLVASHRDNSTGQREQFFHVAPATGRAIGLEAVPTSFLHDGEWTRGPAGQLRLRTPISIIASMPNSGTTWFLYVIQSAQQNTHGTAATVSDILHPFCNSLLSQEIAKIMGAPEDASWRHIFQTPSPAALDLLVELVSDQMHSKAISELQYMRQHGVTVVGQPLPQHLVWPWKGMIDPRKDATRIQLLLTKEIINVFQLVQHVQHRYSSGLQPVLNVVGLYRHRAHMFPMSNKSNILCKECMLHAMVLSFEANSFVNDRPMAGLQRWWRRRSRHVGGHRGACALIFAHLIVWYTVLRVMPFGVAVLDYARLMLFDRRQLREYLDAVLPPHSPFRENPGIAAFASSVDANRFASPVDFLESRERMYAALGVEAFARNAIAEMHRLDPVADLSLLDQPPDVAASIQHSF